MAKGTPASVGYRQSAPDAKLRALGFPTGAPSGLLAPGTPPPAELKPPRPAPASTGQVARPGKQSGNAGNEPTS